PEWQRELTVNQPPYGFEGSSPSSPTIFENRPEAFPGDFLLDVTVPRYSRRSFTQEHRCDHWSLA
ncbi:MAG: hypothetical protein J0G36_21795, partial [Afipia sp.]|nr:hypothetical protein [Afipia sp.]